MFLYVSKWLNHLVNSISLIFKGRSGTAATIQTLLARFFILAINLATGLITARNLGATGRGEQAAMILFPQFFAYILSLGLPTALLYNIRRYPQEQSKSFSAALLLGTVLGTLASVVGILFIPFWLANYSADVVHFSQWLMIAAPTVVFTEVFRSAMEARQEFTIANQIRYLPPLVTFVILIVLAIVGKLTPFTSTLAYWIPGIPILFWMAICSQRFFKLNLQLQKLEVAFKRLLNYGLRSYGIDLLSTLSLQIDQVLVVGLLSPTDMGMYVVSLSFSRVLNVFHTSIVTVLFPKAVSCPLSEVVEMSGRAARVSTAFTLLSGILLALLGPTLLHLLYGAEFMGAVTVFRILTLEVVIAGATMILAQVFMALGKPEIVTLLQGVGLGLSIPLMLGLIPLYGLVGAGIALLCSTIARFAFVLLCFPLLLKVRPPSLLVRAEDLDSITKILWKRV